MELVMEEYGQTFLAILVMGCGIAIVFQVLINEGMLHEMVRLYIDSICNV